MPSSQRVHSKSISTIFSRYLLAGLVLTILIISFFWIQSQLAAFHRDSVNLRQTLLKTQKTILRNQVNNALEVLSFHYSQVQKKLKQEIKSQVQEAHAIASDLYQENKDRFSHAAIKDMIKEAFRDVRFNDGRGYYFIVSLEGEEILYPIHPDLEGQNLIDLQDDRGKYVIRDEINIVKNHGQGFVRGHWRKPGSNSEMIYPKISYVQAFEPFDWYIGTGEYLDNVRREIQQEVLSALAEMRYGSGGCVFVKRLSGQTLIEDGQVAVNLKERPGNPGTSSNKGLFKQEKEAAQKASGGFVSYSQSSEGGEPIPYLSFVKTFQPWQWIIGAGLPLADIEAEIERKRELLQARIRSDIIRVVFIMAVLSLFLFLLIQFMHRKMQRNINRLSDTFQQAASKELLAVNVPAFEFSEFRSLAESANTMLQERRKIEAALNLEKIYFEELFQNAPESIVITDTQSTILRINKEFCRLFGFKEEEAVGENLDELIAQGEQVAEAKQITQQVHDGKTVNLETIRRHKNGRRIPVSIFGVPFEVNNQIFVYGIYRDITEKKQIEEDLIRLSETDSLTGLYNRMKFNRMLEEEIRLFRRYKREFSLVMFDIDHFKVVNDTFGHNVGDQVLKQLATLVTMSIRSTDIAARWGGEEFILLFRGSGLEASLKTAERLRSRIEAKDFGEVGQVTCSFGVVQFQEEDSFESVTIRVDQQLYRAKQLGRNQVASG